MCLDMYSTLKPSIMMNLVIANSYPCTIIVLFYEIDNIVDC